LQKAYRLTSRDDFQKVYRSGKSSANKQFVVYVLHRPQTPQFRVGISASKKIGSAVVRNRMRRVIKEIVRSHAEKIAEHVDFIIIVRKPAVEQNYEEMERSLLHVFRRAALIPSRPRIG